MIRCLFSMNKVKLSLWCGVVLKVEEFDALCCGAVLKCQIHTRKRKEGD